MSSDGALLRPLFGDQKFANEKAYARDDVNTVISESDMPGARKEIIFVMNADEDIVTFSYSFDGVKYMDAITFKASPGRWVGAKCGLFARSNTGNDGGYARYDYFELN